MIDPTKGRRPTGVVLRTNFHLSVITDYLRVFASSLRGVAQMTGTESAPTDLA
jgi:hypothetical protein